MKEYSDWLRSMNVRAFQDPGISRSIIRKKAIHFKKQQIPFTTFHLAIWSLYSNFSISFLGSLNKQVYHSLNQQILNLERKAFEQI